MPGNSMGMSSESVRGISMILPRPFFAAEITSFIFSILDFEVKVTLMPSVELPAISSR